jgi:hypothetical protein
MPRHRRAALVVCAAAAVALAVLAAGLPADGFFVGDSGVKLIAVRNVIAHPRHPLDIDVPAIGAVSTPELMDPFFLPHGDHAHAETVAAFPLVTAPLFALFGLRGLVILPMAGFLGSLAGIAWLARKLDDSASPAAVIALGFACCPLLFYGLEFWEHSVAAGLAYAGTALIAGTDRGWPRMIASGLLLGGAILMRPEATCYALAVLAASRSLVKAPPILALALVGVGVAVPLIPVVATNVMHFHNVLGPHIGGNVAGIGASWLSLRAALIWKWLEPSTWTATLLIVAAIVATLAGRLGRTDRATNMSSLVVLVASVALAFVASRRGLPRESIWAVFPAALLVLGALIEDPDARRRGAVRFLGRVVVFDLLLVLATAPNDGGGQWGPRYLMIASGPAVLAVWFILQRIVLDRRALQLSAAVLLIAASLLVQRQAYKELRAAKQYYSRLQQEVLAQTGGRQVLTDLWWLDQVMAARSPSPLFLFAADHERARSAIGLMERARIPSFSIVTAHDDHAAEQIAAWIAGTNFRVGAQHELIESSLTVFRIDGLSER